MPSGGPGRSGGLLGLETRFFTRRMHADLFDRYRPGLVVTTGPGWFFPDAVVLREAAARGVTTATVVLGWDNPTSKGFRAEPDLTIVWSDEMARQVAEHHDYPRDRIVVAGVPHFDDYVRHGALRTREELGLDEDRRLILFATGAPATFGANVAVAEALAKAVASDALGFPSQLIAPPPAQLPARPQGASRRVRAPRGDLRPHATRHSGHPPESLTVDMADSDRLRLGALIKNCDVLVNVFSTTTLEAFLVDRPVVLVSSDVDTDRPTADGLRGFREYEHVRAVIDQRGGGRSDDPGDPRARPCVPRRPVARSRRPQTSGRSRARAHGRLCRAACRRVATRAAGSAPPWSSGPSSERMLRRVPRPRRRRPRPTFPAGASTGWVSHFSQER